MRDVEGFKTTMDDLNMLDEIEFEHLRARDLDEAFIHGDGYRKDAGRKTLAYGDFACIGAHEA
jgi:hypothetical protein